MTYNEYKNHLKVCEYLGKEPVGDFKEVYDFFKGFWDGMEFVVTTWPDMIAIRKPVSFAFMDGVPVKGSECYMTYVPGDDHMKCEPGKFMDLRPFHMSGNFVMEVVSEYLGIGVDLLLSQKNFIPPHSGGKYVQEIGVPV